MRPPASPGPILKSTMRGETGWRIGTSSRWPRDRPPFDSSSIAGPGRCRIDEDGGLVSAESGMLHFHRPYAFRNYARGRRKSDPGFGLRVDVVRGLKVGAYDRSRPSESIDRHLFHYIGGVGFDAFSSHDRPAGQYYLAGETARSIFGNAGDGPGDRGLRHKLRA